MCGCKITAVPELSRSAVSKHLFLLKMAGLAKERRARKWLHYALDGSRGSPYAGKILPLVTGWLNGDPVIKRDRKRGGGPETGTGGYP